MSVIVLIVLFVSKETLDLEPKYSICVMIPLYDLIGVEVLPKEIERAL